MIIKLNEEQVKGTGLKVGQEVEVELNENTNANQIVKQAHHLLDNGTVDLPNGDFVTYNSPNWKESSYTYEVWSGQEYNVIEVFENEKELERYLTNNYGI